MGGAEPFLKGSYRALGCRVLEVFTSVYNFDQGFISIRMWGLICLKHERFRDRVLPQGPSWPVGSGSWALDGSLVVRFAVAALLFSMALTCC